MPLRPQAGQPDHKSLPGLERDSGPRRAQTQACQLNCALGGRGALPGDYQVTVVKAEGPASQEDYAATGRSIPPPKRVLPQCYAAPQKSGLTATIRAEDKSEFRFQLTTSKGDHGT